MMMTMVLMIKQKRKKKEILYEPFLLLGRPIFLPLLWRCVFQIHQRNKARAKMLNLHLFSIIKKSLFTARFKKVTKKP